MNLSTRSRRRGAALAAALTLLVPALAACSGDAEGSGGGGSDSVTLRVGQLGASKVTEALLAAAGEDEGLDYTIEWSLFPTGGPGFYEAIPSGSVDVAQMADTPPIFGQVAGAEAKVVGVQTTVSSDLSTVEIFAPQDSALNDVGDLVGKKVAITEGTILQYTVLRALKAAGLSYSDITPVNLPPADAVAAYQSGDVDAVAALGPQLAQLTIAGDKVVADGVGVTSGYQFSVATSAALADEARSAAIVDLLQRIGRAQAWAAENRPEWTTTYAEVLGVPEEVATVLVDRESYTWLPIDDTVIATQQEQADAYTGLGLIQGELDVTEQFDDRFNGDLVG